MGVHVAGSLFPQRARALPLRLDPAVISAAWDNARNRRVSCELLLRHAFRHRLVVAVVVAAAPNSLPAPRCRLPTPARAPIEANAGDERRRGKGEEAAAMGRMKPNERKTTMETTRRQPHDARRKYRPRPALPP